MSKISITPVVKLYYGAYEANGIIRHKTQRLHGVIQCLSKMGFEIELVPSIHINRLTVTMYDREIFRCDIRNLPFNLDCDDVVCQRLVKVVEEATERIYASSNVPGHFPVTRGKRIIQEIKNAATTQDLFSSQVKLWFEIPANSAVTSDDEKNQELPASNYP